MVGWRNSYASHPAWQLSQRTCTRPTPGGPAPLVVTFGPGPVSLAPQPCPTLVTDAAARPTDSAAAISSSCVTVSLARQVLGPRPARLPSCETYFLFKFQVVCPSESRPAARPLAPAHSSRRDDRACLTSLYLIKFLIALLPSARSRVGSWPRACSRAALASGCVTSFRVSYPRSRVHVVTPVPTSCRSLTQVWTCGTGLVRLCATRADRQLLLESVLSHHELCRAGPCRFCASEP